MVGVRGPQRVRRWCVQWRDEGGKQRTRRFTTLKVASTYTGLSYTVLRKLASAGTVHGVTKDARYLGVKIRRL